VAGKTVAPTASEVISQDWLKGDVPGLTHP